MLLRKNMYDIDIGHIKNISDVYIIMKKTGHNVFTKPV